MMSTTATTFTSATTPTRQVDVAGTRFAYRELGPSTGVPLVLLHHFTATIDDWDPRVLDGIAAERRVVVFDNRGIGGTRGRVPPSVEAMAEDATAFIRALGLTEVDLLGFSLGGFIAQVIATREPRLVRRLLLAGTGPAGFKGVGRLNRRLLTDTAQGAVTLRDPKPLLFFTRTSTGRPAAADYMARLRERTGDRVKRTSLHAAARQMVAITRWGARAPMDLGLITQPTLVANGEDDRMLATRGSFELAHRLPNARLVIFRTRDTGASSSTTIASYPRFSSSCAEHEQQATEDVGRQRKPTRTTTSEIRSPRSSVSDPKAPVVEPGPSPLPRSVRPYQGVLRSETQARKRSISV